MSYLFAIAASDIGMGEAFGNMIVGFGVVFLVLLFLSGVISLFKSRSAGRYHYIYRRMCRQDWIRAGGPDAGRDCPAAGRLSDANIPRVGICTYMGHRDSQKFNYLCP